jgi:hypothetical protein
MPMRPPCQPTVRLLARSPAAEPLQSLRCSGRWRGRHFWELSRAMQPAHACVSARAPCTARAGLLARGEAQSIIQVQTS